ncbi:hypothetical protein FRX31_031505 [Thalictrum thalictroides]|uniref:Zinc finger protein n=1 Tax=Thalictrum thalictroides TaxID=46969 RepID=A0A7J6V1P2_THATH|nr:hypothetical protein FRX31_031505 [Thalictrum thalictroides]
MECKLCKIKFTGTNAFQQQRHHAYYDCKKNQSKLKKEAEDKQKAWKAKSTKNGSAPGTSKSG